MRARRTPRNGAGSHGADKTKVQQYTFIVARKDGLPRSDPEAHRRASRRLLLKRKYGLTEAEWQELFERQGRRCAICGEGGTRWSVDHDHATGRIRGILCRACNTGIGLFRDDPARLLSAIRYLTRDRTES